MASQADAPLAEGFGRTIAAGTRIGARLRQGKEKQARLRRGGVRMATTRKVAANNGAIRASLVICAMVLTAAALYFASSVFAPLAFALFILAIVWPLQERLETLMPKGVALFLTLSITVLVMLVLASMIAWSLSAVGDWLLNNVQRFQALYLQATKWLEEHGIFVAGILAERFDVIWLVRLFQEIAKRLNRLAGFAILVFVFLMMALLEVSSGRGSRPWTAGEPAPS